MAKKILEQIKNIVKPQYDRLDSWVHSWHHIERVFNNSQQLASLEGVDSINPGISAYCHDLGRITEEERKKTGKLFIPHALFSIESTVNVLKKVGVSGKDFGEIIEAVAVHSYWVYEGKNNSAKILQDADKMAGFDYYGLLSTIPFFTGKNYISPKEIIKNKNNPEKLKEFWDRASNKLTKEELISTIKGIEFVLEWYDKIHFSSAKKLLEKNYLIHQKEKSSLINKL